MNQQQKQQTDPAALKAAYRYHIKKFVDEIEDTHKLCVIYSFIQGLWLGKKTSAGTQKDKQEQSGTAKNKRGEEEEEEEEEIILYRQFA